MFNELYEGINKKVNEAAHSVHLDSNASYGTKFVGEFPVSISYDTLEAVLGDPTYYDVDGTKIRVEWDGVIDGHPFAIYDWKDSSDIEDVTDWHVGGKSVEVIDLLFDCIKTYVFPQENNDVDEITKKVFDFLNSADKDIIAEIYATHGDDDIFPGQERAIEDLKQIVISDDYVRDLIYETFIEPSEQKEQ